MTKNEGVKNWILNPMAANGKISNLEMIQRTWFYFHSNWLIMKIEQFTCTKCSHKFQFLPLYSNAYTNWILILFFVSLFVFAHCLHNVWNSTWIRCAQTHFGFKRKKKQIFRCTNWHFYRVWAVFVFVHSQCFWINNSFENNPKFIFIKLISGLKRLCLAFYHA